MLEQMKNSGYALPAKVYPWEIQSIRQRAGLTQRQLSLILGCSVPTVQRWEEGESPVNGPAALLLHLLFLHPDLLERYRIPEKTAPIRMWYMHEQQPCTLIDADPTRQTVHIWNYTDNLQFRAFGKTEKPSYEDYEAFLESRCFPRSRDKVKLMLREMDIPMYDPMLIIEKTKGRMAEDNFWICLE